ncbi:MAG: YihY/virulence factor BrkB family protein [Proteiniphilum sp.]|nr:YihY/virulence factor BrkB family protein [Proteiniphilum sp.]
MARRRKKRDYDEEERPGRLERMKIRVKDLLYFLSYGIWRQNPETLSNKQNILYNIIKTVILTVRNVQELDIAASARSLTYRTLLSIVPLLAVIFAIARGFGIENIMESSIFGFMLGEMPAKEMVAVAPDLNSDGMAVFSDRQGDTLSVGGERAAETLTPGMAEEATADGRTREFLNLLFQLIDKSLEEARGGGIFAGIGILLFLYTIMNLFGDIENNFNKIWRVMRGRSIGRKVTDFSAMVLLIPFFFVLVNALNIISYPQNNTLKILYILYPFIPRLLNIVPLVVIIFIFTALYKFLPNTKVKLFNALIAGALAGVAFQFFQMLYLSGQLWITRYNAIYGTFAAIPLMLLWLQMSWFIVLIGAEISYAAQNVRNFSFEKETRNISRRYRDFFTLMITSAIVQRFADEKLPLTAEQLSLRCKVPARLTSDILDELLELRIIAATPSPHDERDVAYQPAVDINLITVNGLMRKLDERGSEDFMIDMEGDFREHWDALVSSRMSMHDSHKDQLIKDL